MVLDWFLIVFPGASITTSGFIPNYARTPRSSGSSVACSPTQRTTVWAPSTAFRAMSSTSTRWNDDYDDDDIDNDDDEEDDNDDDSLGIVDCVLDHKFHFHQVRM